MCGIVGYVGPKNVVPLIIEGLRRLEYRGYDSAGIAVAGQQDNPSKLDVRRYDTIDGKKVVVVNAERGPIVTETLSFDTDSGLLLRRVVQTKTAYGALAEQVDYSDYKDVAGIKIPFTIKHTTWNQVTTEKFTDAKVNAQIDDALFAKK